MVFMHVVILVKVHTYVAKVVGHEAEVICK